METTKQLFMAGVSDAERVRIATVLEELARKGSPWRLGRDGKVDLILADFDKQAGREAHAYALLQKLAFAKLAETEPDPGDAALVLRRPITAQGMFELLSRVDGADLRPQGRDLEPAVVVQAAPATSFTARADTKRTRFDRAVAGGPYTNIDRWLDRGSVWIERPGQPAFVLDPTHDAYYCTAPLGQLEDYFRRAIDAVEVRAYPLKSLNELRSARTSAPIARLRWLGALLRSDGRLAPHLDPRGTYWITRWLPLDSAYRREWRIAGRLLRPTSLSRVAATANVSMSEVFDVVNAYSAAGRLEWTPCRSSDSGKQVAVRSE